MNTNKKHIFSHLEKKCFIEILKNYSQVVEMKETDSAALRAKNEAWDEITRQYNAGPHVGLKVTTKQLRRLWMNLKQRQRESRLRQRSLTSGGETSTLRVVLEQDKEHTKYNNTPLFASDNENTCNNITPMFASEVKNTVLEREYRDRQRRAEEVHQLEIELLRERIREAKAKADLAEILLHQKRSASHFYQHSPEPAKIWLSPSNASEANGQE